MNIREKILDLAGQKIGYIEKKSNITEFNEWYGNGANGDGKKGWPWCATFVSYIYFWAGFPLPKIDTNEGFHYVPTLYHRARQNFWITNDPKPGDIVLIDFDGNGTWDHTGIFVEWADAMKTKFKTIEGNTSPDHRGSQSNGGGVYSRIRSFEKSKIAFVNVIDK